MSPPHAPSGHTRNGLPYNRLGDGADVLVVFDGIGFQNEPSHGIEARLSRRTYSFLSPDYEVFVVKRRRGLAPGASIRDMSEDYAEMIRAEFSPPVDLIGLSYGGVIALEFAAGHPQLVRKLVLHSTSYKASSLGKELLTQARDAARQGDWKRSTAAMMEAVYRPSWYKPAVIWALQRVAALSDVSGDPSDFVVAVDAELGFDFSKRLGEISAPTLLAAGERDLALYAAESMHEMADTIPDCRFVFYPRAGHPVKGRQFERDVLGFLRD